MYVYQAPENDSNTILRGADKDCTKISPYITGALSSIFTHFDYVYLSCGFWCCVFFFSCYFLLPFSQGRKMCSLFLSHYFCNLVCSAFFLLRPFYICFAIEVVLEFSFSLLFWRVILDLLLNRGLSSEKHVTSTERHFSTCCLKMLS